MLSLVVIFPSGAPPPTDMSICGIIPQGKECNEKDFLRRAGFGAHGRFCGFDKCGRGRGTCACAFAFTDAYLKPLVEAGCKIFYRLGVTIENNWKIKAYNIYPPKDFAKWARICEHVVRHYNEGWAHGFKWGIEYWEIWNEPENLPMW